MNSRRNFFTALMGGTDLGEIERDQTAPEPCSSGCSCASSEEPMPGDGLNQFFAKEVDRRRALSVIAGTTAAGAALASSACSVTASADDKERQRLEWQERFKGNYRQMTADEKGATVERLERLWELEHSSGVEISDAPPIDKVLYGYAFNISKCQGYLDCVAACKEENNADRDSNLQYIRIFEVPDGVSELAAANDEVAHEVPADGHYYLGTQCFHCENPPCTKVCPVGATWKEPDGIVVVDYDWCIGCRYCEAACPYFGRRFNWSEPTVPQAEINPDQHYLGNRPRRRGVMEKCTFCIQRSRAGKLPACVDACPTGARVFGNLLDPDSEIRYVLANKKVFRLKEELGTEPKFWYFSD